MNNVFIKEVQSSWFCIPETKTNNRKAIFFAISDSYSFAAANVIMGLNQYSPSLMETCDVIIYSNDLSEKNKVLLRQLHSNTFFLNMVFPESWSDIVTHKKTIKWGNYVICKYFGFFLIQNYEKVLHLDADVHIRSDISELFEIEEDMAWRNVLAWKASENFCKVMKDQEDRISAGNGGLIYFTDRLKRFRIGETDVVNAFETVKGLKHGGNDECIIAWIAYDKKATIKELDVKIWNTPVQRMTPETKLIHFLDYVHTSTKPWKNLAAYLYFDEWAENYQRWISMGGEGLVNFTHDDYYRLFSFDKLNKIEKQGKMVKEKEQELAEWKRKYNQIRISNSWRITAPLRKIRRKMKIILKFLKR